MASYEVKPVGETTFTEKADSTEDSQQHEQQVAQVKVVKGTAAYNEAYLTEPPPIWHRTTITLMFMVMLGFFCQTMNGFDGSLFGGLTANPYFLQHFHGANNGIWAGIVSSMYQIGGVCALPFVGPAIDTWGRKVGMLIGGVLVICGTIITGTTLHNASVGQFEGGRFLLGFGVSIASAAGPIYVVETAHPAFRSVLTGYCNTFWFTGSILAAGAVRGGLDLVGNTSWQIPIWLQCFFPGWIILLIIFIPESPRWLYVHNKQEKAIAMLTKWHGYGNRESAWVKLELAEYEEHLVLDGADKRFWDYRALFRSRASMYRLGCNICFSISTQWAGNGVLTYFLPAVLTTAGYTNNITQANINLGYSCFQFVFALTGAAFVERIGRRPLMLFSMFGCAVCWIAVTAATGIYNNDTTNSDAARASVGFIFIFGAVYSIGFTPLQALYPVEVLSFEMRAKGMAFSSLATSASGLLNQFAWPVSLKAIGWHTYIIFMIWDVVQGIVFYFFLPETKGRTLEELDAVFAERNPVKASKQRTKLLVGNDASVIGVEKV